MAEKLDFVQNPVVYRFSQFIIHLHATCILYPSQVLEVLWELAHLPTLPTTLVQQALEEHLTILSDAYAVKETVKRSYIIKCIEDIKKVRSEFRYPPNTCRALLASFSNHFTSLSGKL